MKLRISRRERRTGLIVGVVLAVAGLAWCAPAAASAAAGSTEHPVLHPRRRRDRPDESVWLRRCHATANAEHRCDRQSGRGLPEFLDDARVLAEPRAGVRGPLSAAHQCVRRDPLRRPRQFAGVAVRNHDAEGAEATRLRKRPVRQVPPHRLGRQRGQQPVGYTAPHQLGWDYFAGLAGRAPHPIDTTAGGVAPTGVSYPCGFVPNASDDPANAPTPVRAISSIKSCRQVRGARLSTPGRACLERGGFLAPKGRAVVHVPAPGFHAAERLLRRAADRQSPRWHVYGGRAQDPFGAGAATDPLSKAIARSIG